MTAHDKLLKQFRMEGQAVSCERYGFGHINETYLVVTDCGHRYILQRISTSAFKDVTGLMNNIYLVTGHLRARTENPHGVMTIIKTVDGGIFCQEGESYWRMYDFVEGSVALQASRNTEDFYQSAIAFGEFQSKLADFPVEQLVETIPNFHNTVDRYRIFTKGFLTACTTLTDQELEMLPMGAKTMTMECGVRFLTDYLDGDHYFAVHREGHNLDRARTQFKLVQDMDRKMEAMKAIVKEESGR